MKKIITILTAVLLVTATATAVSATLLSPGLDVIANDCSMTVSALTGETVTFTKAQFTDAVGDTSFSGITVTELPDSSDGILCFGDVAVTEGQVISSSSLSKLYFEPCENVDSTSFKFCVDSSYAMTCNVKFNSKVNTAPKVYKGQEITVFQKNAQSGEMRAADADGDSLYFEVIDYPAGGDIAFDSTTGEFTYTAGSRVMEDSFTYRVKDSFGAYSDIARVFVLITENESEKVFSDMKGKTTATAVTVMADAGYMSGTEKGGKLCFEPDAEISRLDFLVTAMNVFGAAKIPDIENTGFVDDNEIPGKYKGYVYSAAKLGIINGTESEKGKCFNPSAPVTKAEASVILNNIIGYSASTPVVLEGIPVWAEDAVCAMYELGVYRTEGRAVDCASALTREDAAEMLYKVYCLIGE